MKRYALPQAALKSRKLSATTGDTRKLAEELIANKFKEEKGGSGYIGPDSFPQEYAYTGACEPHPPGSSRALPGVPHDTVRETEPGLFEFLNLRTRSNGAFATIMHGYSVTDIMTAGHTLDRNRIRDGGRTIYMTELGMSKLMRSEGVNSFVDKAYGYSNALYSIFGMPIVVDDSLPRIEVEYKF